MEQHPARLFFYAMKLLQRYVTGSFLTAFLLGVLVLTFVLSVGLLVKAMELVVRGLAPGMILNFLMVSIPQSLTFTVPLAALASALLLFGRLSTDSEISSMKACGVDVWLIMWPLAGLGLVMAAASIYINQEISPRSHFERHSLTAMAKSGAVLDLLQPGHFIQEFPGMTFWFAKRDGNELSQLLIFDKSRDNHNREVRAERALMEVRGEDLWLDMYNVRIEPFSVSNPGAVTAERLTQVIEGAMKPRQYKLRVASLPHRDLQDFMAEVDRELDEIQEDIKITAAERELALADAKRRLSEARTENQRRFALGFAPLIFILLGMPLGIRSHRRESNIGVIISLVVMLLYYSFLIITKTLAKRPEFHPHLLIWLPTFICVSLAVVLIGRNR